LSYSSKAQHSALTGGGYGSDGQKNPAGGR